MEGYDAVAELLELVKELQKQVTDLQEDYKRLKSRVLILESRGPGMSQGW